VSRIFLTLAIVSNLGLAGSFVLGWTVIEPDADAARGVSLSVHVLVGLAALLLTLLVHAIVLTYFMGTGRWIEETSQAYGLSVDYRAENVRLKYRTLPGMVGCLVLLILTAASGAAADPAAALGWPAAKTVHLLLASLSLLMNLAICALEHQTIHRNGKLVDQIMSAVTALREGRGRDVVSRTAR
jgi:hypothetical protein